MAKRKFLLTLIYPLFRIYQGYKTHLLKSLLPSRGFFLDAGCGEGDILKKLYIPGKREGVGIDINLPPLPLPQVKGDLHHLPFKDSSFDIVLVVDVLHHLENPLKALKEFKRVTRKYIFIFDHPFQVTFLLPLLTFLDYRINLLWGNDLPSRFFPPSTWKSWRETLGLEEKYSRRGIGGTIMVWRKR